MAQDPQQTEAMKQWGQVVTRAWSDDAFKQRLLSDPKAVLAEAGLPVPANQQVQVHEATPTHLHLVLPPPPGREGQKLSAAELDQAAGGIVHDSPEEANRIGDAKRASQLREDWDGSFQVKSP